MLGHLGDILSHLSSSWLSLSHSWRHPGLILGLSGALDLQKTLVFQRVFDVFDVGPTSLQLSYDVPSWLHLGPPWGHEGHLALAMALSF